MSQLAMELPAGRIRVNETSDSFPSAVHADAAEVAAVLSRAFPQEKWDADRALAELIENSSVLKTFVHRDGSRIVATASAKKEPRFPDAGYVHWVGVIPEHQGQSLGSRLVRAVASEFGERTAVVLETDDDRLPAISTYLALGFVPRYIGDDHTKRWSTVFQNLSSYRKAKAGQ